MYLRRDLIFYLMDLLHDIILIYIIEKSVGSWKHTKNRISFTTLFIFIKVYLSEGSSNYPSKCVLIIKIKGWESFLQRSDSLNFCLVWTLLWGLKINPEPPQKFWPINTETTVFNISKSQKVNTWHNLQKSSTMVLTRTKYSEMLFLLPSSLPWFFSSVKGIKKC